MESWPPDTASNSDAPLGKRPVLVSSFLWRRSCHGLHGMFLEGDGDIVWGYPPKVSLLCLGLNEWHNLVICWCFDDAF